MSDVSPKLRSQVVTRAGGRCEYCRLSSEGQVAWFPVDHIIPQSQGGKTELDNLALACPRCNGHKWAHQEATDPETRETVLLFHPRRQKWDEHFRYSQDLEVKGTTPCGRATVALLKMNEPPLPHVRRLLASLGISVEERDG